MMEDLVGHGAIQQFLDRLLKTKKIPHAMLFYGPAGVGKEHFAKEFARQLIGRTRQEHPDIRVYSLEKTQSVHTMATMRQLKEEAYLPPFEAPYKVLIVEDADHMLPTSGSALLKTLEEPSLPCKIILVAKHLSALLPTIVSRCCKVAFSYLHPEEIQEYLIQKHSLEVSQAATLAEMSCGSLDKALFLTTEAGALWQKTLFEVVLEYKKLPFHLWQEKLSYLEEQAEAHPCCSRQGVYEDVLRIMRDLMVCKYLSDESLLYFKDKHFAFEEAARQMKLSPMALQKIWQQGYESLSCHVKLKIGLEHLLLHVYA